MLMDYEVQVIPREIKREMTYEGTAALSYTIQYPQFFSKIFQPVLYGINHYYEEKAKLFLQYCENDLYKTAVEDLKYSVANQFPIHKYEAMLVYQITYNQNAVLSLYFDQYEYTGGAHGSTVRSSDTWSLHSGKKLSLKDFFPLVENYEAYIIENIYGQIEQQMANQTNQYFNDYKKLVVENFNEKSFYITPEGVIVYYQQYDIAPYVAGIVEFLIPSKIMTNSLLH